MKTIAERINEGMALRGLTASELASRAGIDKGALSHYRKGHYLPKQDNIYRIARALDVPEAWLMGYDVPIENDQPQASDELLSFALFGDSTVVTAEDLADIRKFAEFIKDRRKNDNA